MVSVTNWDPRPRMSPSVRRRVSTVKRVAQGVELDTLGPSVEGRDLTKAVDKSSMPFRSGSCTTCLRNELQTGVFLQSFPLLGGRRDRWPGVSGSRVDLKYPPGDPPDLHQCQIFFRRRSRRWCRRTGHTGRPGSVRSLTQGTRVSIRSSSIFFKRI